ncbi:hypothetical protein EDD85DRAFT_117727 [Armillaria nabsnona]|nr:hypothetical protein EDD85DRAFT_117727 [Armillaria nabsnona]
MSFRNFYSNVYVHPCFEALCHCYAILTLCSTDSAPYAFSIAQDWRTSSEGAGDAANFDPALSSARCNSTSLVNPLPLPVPDGYRVVRLHSNFSDDWSRLLTLDASYNFCYERKPTKDFRLECPLHRCSKVIQGYEILKHLKVYHPGFYQDDRYFKVICIECKMEEMEVRYYANHVLEAHCNVSACCAYCGLQLIRGDSMMLHHIASCDALIPYRRGQKPVSYLMLHSIDTNPGSLAELECVQKNLIPRLISDRLSSGARVRLVKFHRQTLGIRKRKYAFSWPNDHLSCAMTLVTNGTPSKNFVRSTQCDFPSQYTSIPPVITNPLVTFRRRKYCR